ncbi:hypothetical protein ISS37_06675 [candidate division KSB1 bacterium]|nr:hypothetical protein [candidate division KSB1 bacterium]
MKSISLYCLSYILILVLTSGSFAVNEGTPRADYLLLGIRPSSLGGAFTALSDEAVGAYYNPAGLAFSPKFSGEWFLLRSQSQWWSYGVDYPLYHVNISYRSNRLGTLGFNYVKISYGRDIRTDETGQIIKDSDIYDKSYLVSFSKIFFSNLSFGINLKFLQDIIYFETDEFYRDTYSWDMGLLIRNLFPKLTFEGGNNSLIDRQRGLLVANSEGLSLGFSLMNMGLFTNHSDRGMRFYFPQIVRVGMAYRAVKTPSIQLLVAGDVEYINLDDRSFMLQGTAGSTLIGGHFSKKNRWIPHFGLEIRLHGFVFMRMGSYRFYDDYEYNWVKSFGLGFGNNQLNMNYCWEYWPHFPRGHSAFSIRTNIGM